MPRITDFVVVRTPTQPTLTIRTHTSVDKLPQLIGASYASIAQYLEELGEIVADVPFVGYYNMDMQNLDVEIGFPVSKALPGKGNIKASEIPEEKVVFCMYLGSYSEMEPVYTEMMKWIDDNGYQPLGSAYEQYYNGPEQPENELLTKIVMPIK